MRTRGGAGVVLAALSFGALGRAAPPPPSESPQFHVERMRVPGRLVSVHAEDLDGNGRRDLLAVYLTGAPPDVKRWLGVFFDRGGFHPAPDQQLAVPAAASFVDVADVAGDGHAEILLGDNQGLLAFGLTAGVKGKPLFGAPHRLLAIDGMSLLADEEDLPWLDLARDWDGDGKVEILLPFLDRFALLTRAGDAWSRTGELRLPSRSAYSVHDDLHDPRVRDYFFRVAYTVPELHVGDYDGDGRGDLIAILDDRVTVFLGQREGVFAAAPAASIHLALRSEAEAARPGATNIQITVVDLDGDGIVDLAVDKVTGGIGTMQAQTGFYYGRKGGGWGKPAQTLTRDGFAGALAFADLDGDHLPELIMPHTNMGFPEAARVLLTKRLALGFEVHRNHGAKGYGNTPDVVRVVDLSIDYSGGAELDAPFPSLAGDFNGDGIADFAGGKGSDSLAVWPGGGKSLISEFPRAIVRVPLTRYWSVIDLDGDRRADILLYYRNRAQLEGQIAVLRNTGLHW